MKTTKRKEYFLYCVICGDEMHVTRHDARTCSDECRIALSMVTKDLKIRQFSNDKTITPEQKEAIQAKVESATGEGRVLKKVLHSKKTEPAKEEDAPDAAVKKEEVKETDKPKKDD